jgi:hypothetical protein
MEMVAVIEMGEDILTDAERMEGVGVNLEEMWAQDWHDLKA